ncbi:MAG: precorrin-4 C(11)-methyltransferase [Oligoflexia bacterium]|nr:precorrin-4 C(11)-methyltransferase [Oligoflexia bacterium]
MKDNCKGKVFFVGAGPGDPELITIKAAKTIAKCPVVIYAGSLVSEEIIKKYVCRDININIDTKVYNSASMTLEDVLEVMVNASSAGLDVARVHTGDPSIYSSISEQIRELNKLQICWEVIPGVSSFQAAAATLGQELTLPELSQTIILTRVEGRTAVPAKEDLALLAQTRATMVFFLSSQKNLLKKLVDELIPYYGHNCPAWVVYRASWPDQKIIKSDLINLESEMLLAGISSQSIIVVGDVLGANDFENSKLYSSQFSHLFRMAETRNSEMKEVIL